MKYLALDTNIYLDMVVSRNPSHKPEAYNQMKRLLDYGEIKLVVPSIVRREVERHINSEIEKIYAHLKVVKKNVESLYWINNIDEMKIYREKLPNASRAINELKNLFETNKEKYILDAIQIFENLFSHKNAIFLDETADILFKAQLRQLHKKRPFHNNDQEKDSLADAVIIESLIEYTNNSLLKYEHMYFITRNTKDFSVKGENDKLHPEIQESISSLNLENQFHYRILFNNTLIDDFKFEAEHAGFLEELEEEMEEERLKELDDMYSEHHRELVGLPSISSDWEEIVNECNEFEYFKNQLNDYKDELISQYDNLSEEYFALRDELKKMDLTSVQQSITNFNSLDNEKLEQSSDSAAMQDEIISLIEERMNIDVENYDIYDKWNCDDNFSVNKTFLKFEDFNDKFLTVTIEGELNPENKGTDWIEVRANDEILGKKIKGNIEVSYGYMNFDEDNHPADGMEEEVNFYLEDVIEVVQDVSQHILNQIQKDSETLIDIKKKLGI